MLEFVLAVIVLVLIPGPNTVIILAQTLGGGRRAGFATVAGVELGTLVHTMAAALGFSALLSTSPVAFAIVKFAGVIYLAIVGVRTMFSPAPTVGRAEARPYTAFRRAFVTNVLNPKVAVFFLAFLPQFVSANEAHPLGQMLELSAVFMLMTFVVFVGYGLFAASIRDHVITRPRVLTWMRRTFAAAFVALGAKLAFSER